MLLLYIFSFLAGIVTILSPCILPILPIVLSSSLGGGKERPFGIVAGFILSFTFFTLFLTTIVKSFGIPADSLRSFSMVVIFLFGLSLLIPQVQSLLEKLFAKLSGLVPTGGERKGFVGGMIIGVSIGLLWTPCVGPILASVISLALTGSVTIESFLITLAYSLGTAIPMFFIIFGGQKVLTKVPWLLKNTGTIQKIFGIVMMLTALSIYLNFDRQFQSYILQKFPNYGVGLTQFEDNQKVLDELNNLNGDTKREDMGKTTADLLDRAFLAPELIPGGEFFNTSQSSVQALPDLALKGEALQSLRGKVVLIDFWTYTCINCIRTLPYLRDWHQKYSDKGLVIIGVHTPEFEFEKDPENVQKAINDFDLEYIVMQDNDYETWEAYNNRYWPAKYLIDKDGKIRYNHFGEGSYDQTEKAIQTLLSETGADVSDSAISNKSYNIRSQTPELYLGYGRIEYLTSPERIILDKEVVFSKPQLLKSNFFAYEGKWVVGAEYATPSTGSKLYLNFAAKEVFLVARPKNGGGSFRVLLNESTVANENMGEDVDDEGMVEVDTDRLYKLIDLQNPGRNELILEFLDSNLELYAFTFG